jgi:glycerol-3-phosphate dehydrogenase
VSANGAPGGLAVARRAAALQRLRADTAWDLVVVGGGATGLSVALEAATRGWSVALLEADDYAKGTSSRATKLLHGGVRYLAQGDVGLVREALRERAHWLEVAPHLAQPLAFVVPARRGLDLPFYGAGLKAYELLAGTRSLGRTQWLSSAATRRALPTVRAAGLSGGVRYWDAQFDDARLAVALARTAAARGAVVLNQVRVTGLERGAAACGPGRLVAVRARDAETGEDWLLRTGCVVNATGVWVDALRALDCTAGEAAPAPMVAPSQGVHLVVDRAFLPGHEALLVPKTADGRVLFAVPWLGKTVLGTTDTPRADAPAEPLPLAEEVDFILREAARHLERVPTRADVRSAWVGLRPLVRPAAAGSGQTKSISREHTVAVSASGLVTVTGGKWTTARSMAEDVLAQCQRHGLLAPRPARLGGAVAPLLGAWWGPGSGSEVGAARALAEPPGEALYGSEVAALQALPGAQRWLARDAETGQGVLSEAMVRFAAREEMARSVEDVLARRSRLLFLDAAQAGAVADAVAQVLADELGPAFDAAASAQALRALARQYGTV